MHPPAMRMPYYSIHSEHPIDDSPLDLAPRRLIAPRRRFRELSIDHTIYRAPNLLVNDDLIDAPMNRDIESMVTIASDVEQPESPPVIKYF